ncbi:MAG: MogA/MoaB family molybdenum cofactor biosynthesis protein [Desulfovibrio sp.]|jgi:molybdenum cofactor synthesis domain-containing protein|nr:MogA/MoaB family molybdenum cofactor biosynthesis protein [Desulfovibrio sp.]
MYRAAVLTISDTGFAGGREDASGPEAAAILKSKGYETVHYAILPDERKCIADELKRLADEQRAELILTTGGTGFAPRDVTPEATLDAVERLCPGIPEVMRAVSFEKTRRAVLSRATAGIRGGSLIVNLPGSPAAVRECLLSVIDEIGHGLDILCGRASECGRHN